MFNLISKHRNSIMGVSAIIILVHHYFTNILDKQYKFGAIGVDLFMFVMGLGLYFSLYKGTENKGLLKALPSFYYRRFIKIFPVFAVFLIFWGIWKYTNGGFTLKDFFLNLSFTGYWTLPYNHYFNWFISGILLFYILAPIFFFIIHKPKQKFLFSIITFVLLSALTALMRKNESGEITRTLIMVVRLIPFSFGMLFGAYCKEEPKKVNRNIVIVFFSVLFGVGIILYFLNNLIWNDSGFTYGMPWYSFGLMTPALSLIIAFIADIFSKYISVITKIICFFGKMSFEIYLTHVFVIEYVLYSLYKENNLWFSEPLNFISAFFISTLSAYLLYCFSEKIKSIGFIKSKIR